MVMVGKKKVECDTIDGECFSFGTTNGFHVFPFLSYLSLLLCGLVHEHWSTGFIRQEKGLICGWLRFVSTSFTQCCQNVVRVARVARVAWVETITAPTWMGRSRYRVAAGSAGSRGSPGSKKSSLPVAEQCAWALGNVAGEGEELRDVLLSQGALQPLARMMLPNKGSTVRTAAWALSNLIKGHAKAATELIRLDGVLDAILRHLKRGDEELATEVAWVVVYLTALSNVATSMLAKSDLLQILVGRLASSNSLELLIPVLRSLGNLVAGDSYVTDNVLVAGNEITVRVIQVMIKCLSSEHRVLKKESAWALSNVAAGSVEHKKLIHSSGAVSILIRLLSTSPFDIRKEVAYVLGNLCVAPSESGRPVLIVDHLVSLVGGGCLSGFTDLVRSADIEAARLGLQFLELVLRGMPNGEGPKLVEAEDGIEAMERFQFHENEELRSMANQLVDKYFGEEYGLDS
ncbi:importin subunit alpha-9-like isoform X2 [Salvia splendens]|uniref:importin subunit alpha-9-like isoform X2 n=1 Tax=Salvia splendens TaxID=180675 RepID=UPI001C273A4F|nr:importin subunit alpha-9-like isoform X2 [Salvia splendens]